MFYRYSCGCIATAPGESIIIVKYCDDDMCGTMFEHATESRVKNLNAKECTQLEAEEEKRLVMEIGSLVAQGYDFRTIRNLITR